MSKNSLRLSNGAARPFKSGLTLLCLSLLLSSCATPSLPPIKQTEVVPVPKALTQLTPDPLEGKSLSGLTNGQLFSLIRQYQAGLASCNSDKSIIEQFLVPLSEGEESTGSP